MGKNLKVWKYQVLLVKMWRNEDSCTLLVGGQISANPLESNLEIQLDDIHIPGPSNSSPWYMPQKHFAPRHHETHWRVLIGGLFTVATKLRNNLFVYQ